MELIQEKMEANWGEDLQFDGLRIHPEFHYFFLFYHPSILFTKHFPAPSV